MLLSRSTRPGSSPGLDLLFFFSSYHLGLVFRLLCVVLGPRPACVITTSLRRMSYFNNSDHPLLSLLLFPTAVFFFQSLNSSSPLVRHVQQITCFFFFFFGWSLSLLMVVHICLFFPPHDVHAKVIHLDRKSVV